MTDETKIPSVDEFMAKKTLPSVDAFMESKVPSVESFMQGRSTASTSDAAKRVAIEKGAKILGIDPVDYATAISYESAGTFDPWVKGPRTKWGQHRGTIQYGEPQQKEFGVYKGQSFEDQVTNSNVKYLKQRGVKPGMTFAEIYKTINAGNPHAPDDTPEFMIKNGRRVSTGRTTGDNVRKADTEHRPKVLQRFFGGMPSLAPQPNPLVEQGVIDPVTYTPAPEQTLTPINERQWDSLPDGTAVAPQIAQIAPPVVANPVAEQPDDELQKAWQTAQGIDAVAQASEAIKGGGSLKEYETTQGDLQQKYAEWLKTNGLQDDNNNRESFNIEQQAENEKANFNANEANRVRFNESLNRPQPTQQARPQAKQTPQTTQPVQAQPKQETAVEASFDYNPNATGSYADQDLNATAQQVSAQTGVDEKIVRSFIKQKGYINPNESESQREEQAKQGLPQRRIIDANAVRELKAYAEQAKGRQAEADLALKTYAENGYDDVMSDIAVKRDLGDITQEEANAKIEAYKELIERHGGTFTEKGRAGKEADDKSPAYSFDPKYGVAGILGFKGVRDVLFGDGSVDVETVEKGVDADIKKYGSIENALKAYKKQDESVKFSRKAGTGGSFAEAAKTIGRYVAKLPATAGELGAVYADINPLISSIMDTESTRKSIMNTTKQYRDAIDNDLALGQNPAYKADFVANQLADTVAQLGTQMILTPLTGGASLALPIAEAGTSQYRQADEKGADQKTRLGAFAVGGILAMPQVLLQIKYFKGLTPPKMQAFFDNIQKGIISRLGGKVAKEEAEVIAKNTVIGIATQLAKNGATNIPTEYLQERTEDFGNALYEKATYNKDLKWKDIFVPSAEQVKGYMAAGLGGGIGAVTETVISRMNNAQLAEAEDDISSLVEELRVEQQTANRKDRLERLNQAITALKAIQTARANKEAYFAKDAEINAQTKVQQSQPQVESVALATDNDVEVQAETKGAPEKVVEETVVEPVTKTPNPAFKQGKPKEVIAEGEKEYSGVDDFFAEEAPVENVADPKAELKAQKAERAALVKLGYTVPVQKTLSAEQRADIVANGVRYEKPVKTPTVTEPVTEKPVAQKLDTIKALQTEKQERIAEINDEATSLEAQGEVIKAKNLRATTAQVIKEYNGKIAEAKKGKDTPLAKAEAEILYQDDDGNYITQEKNGAYKIWKSGVTHATLAGTVNLKQNGLEKAKERLAQLSSVDAVSTEKPKIQTPKKETAPPKDDTIREGDVITNGDKTGIYKEIEHNGKIHKRVWFSDSASPLGNSIEYKEGNWTKGQAPTRAVSDLDASAPSFANAKKLPTKTLATNTNFVKNTRIVDNGVIAVDEIAEIELIRRVLDSPTQFYGAMTEPSQVKGVIEKLNKMIAYTTEPKVKANLGKLKNLINRASKHDGTVIFAMSEESLPEEKAHRALYGVRGDTQRTHQIAPDVMEAIQDAPVFKNAKKFQADYAKVSPETRVEEFAVKASLGQWSDLGITSEADKREAKGLAIDFYESFAETNKGKLTPEQIIEKLATEIAYAKDYLESQEIRRNEKEAQNADKDSPVEPAKREKDRPDAESRQAVAPPIGDQTPGKSNAQSDPAEAKEAKAKGQRVRAVSRLFGQEMYYDPQSDVETEIKAEQLVGDMGVADAIAQALTGTPSAEGMRVVQHELERLNAIVDDYTGVEKDAVLDRIATLTAQMAYRQLKTGQEVSIARLLRPLTPAAAQLTATKLLQMKFGHEAQLTTDQTKKLNTIATELQKVKKEYAQLETKYLEAQRIIDSVDESTPVKRAVTHQEQLLKNYEKRKPQILAELQAKFPDSPMFRGGSDIAMMAAPRSEVALDAKTTELLRDYTIGQVLTNRNYESVIAELQEIAGLTTEQAKDVHAIAMDEIRGTKEPASAEAKKRIQIRKEHYTEADKHARPEKFEAKAIANARKSITELERRIAEHDLKVVRNQPVNSAELTAMREEQKALRKTLRDLRKANMQTVKGLSKIAQQAFDRNPEDMELAIAVDLLTNGQPQSVQSVLLYLQNELGFQPSEAKEIAQQAQRLKNEIRAENAKVRDKAKGISDETRVAMDAKRKEVNDATRRLKNILTQVQSDPNLMKRFNDDFRAKLVANYGTQLFNVIQSLTVSSGTESLIDLAEATMRNIGINVGEDNGIRARDSFLAYNWIASNNRQLAEQALANFPEEYFKVHSGLLGDIETEILQLAPFKEGLAKVGHTWFDKNAVLNDRLTNITGAKFQEMYFRNAIVASTFDQIIRKKSDGKYTLESAMKEGKLNDFITESNARYAADKALRVTFASQIDDPIGIQLKRAYDLLDSYVPILINPVVYARFTYTATKVMVMNPLLFGGLDSTKLGGQGYNTRSIAKGVVAWSTVALAYGIMSAIGGDDDKWYTLYPNGKDGTAIDIRRSYPLSSFFYVAHLIQETVVEGKPRPTVDDLLEGFASLETDYFQYGALKQTIENTFDSSKTWGDVGQSSARTLGNYFAGLLRFFKPVRDTFAQFNAEERAYKDDPKTAKDAFVSEISRSLPLVERLSGQEKKYDINGRPIEQQFPIGRIFGVNIVNPAFFANKDSAATAWANKLFPFSGSGGSMSPDEKKLYQARKAIKEARRSGNPIKVETALENMRTQLPAKSLARLKDELKYSELGVKIKYNFGDNEKDIRALQTVWDKATDAEKTEIQSILSKKDKVSSRTKGLFKK